MTNYYLLEQYRPFFSFSLVTGDSPAGNTTNKPISNNTKTNSSNENNGRPTLNNSTSNNAYQHAEIWKPSNSHSNTLQNIAGIQQGQSSDTKSSKPLPWMSPIGSAHQAPPSNKRPWFENGYKYIIIANI
jgi:hypothetical protein